MNNFSYDFKNISEITENYDSKRIPLSAQQREKIIGKYPYYGATKIMDYINDFIFDGTYLLISEDGSVEDKEGKPVLQLPTGKFWVSNHAHVLQGGNDIETKYIYYALQTIKIRPFLTGSVQLKLSQRNLNCIKIPYPESSLIRKKIVSLLSALDEKIELNKNQNKILENLAKVLFKSWFIDFDPVKTKSEGLQNRLSNQISDLFPDVFEDSELGEIPKNWGNTSISHLIEVNPPRKISKNTIAPYLEMKGVPISGHSATGVYNRKFTSGTKFQNGDTLVARITPCLENGKTAMVNFLDEGQIGWGSTEFIVICGKEKRHNPFVYYLSRSDIFREHAIRNMVGSSGRQRVPYDSLCNFTIANPPTIILNIFSEIASSFLQKITIASQEIFLLENIRNTLLPKLISGELRIIEEVSI